MAAVAGATVSRIGRFDPFPLVPLNLLQKHFGSLQHTVVTTVLVGPNQCADRDRCFVVTVFRSLGVDPAVALNLPFDEFQRVLDHRIIDRPRSVFQDRALTQIAVTAAPVSRLNDPSSPWPRWRRNSIPRAVDCSIAASIGVSLLETSWAVDPVAIRVKIRSGAAKRFMRVTNSTRGIGGRSLRAWQGLGESHPRWKQTDPWCNTFYLIWFTRLNAAGSSVGRQPVPRFSPFRPGTRTGIQTGI